MSFFPNPTKAKCPACGDKMTERPSSFRWVLGDWILWAAFILLVFGWNTHIPFLPGLALFMTLAIAWNTARNRLYHSYWMWRHPLRCEKGGHVAPQPEGSR